MSMFQRVLGNAATVDIHKLQTKYENLLFDGEDIEFGFRLLRDVFLFTSYRLILVDVQGITGSKVEYKTIPYKSISRFSLETAGTFDLDAELKIWTSSSPTPTLSKNFNRNMDVYAVQRFLAMKVLGVPYTKPLQPSQAHAPTVSPNTESSQKAGASYLTQEPIKYKEAPLPEKDDYVEEISGIKTRDLNEGPYVKYLHDRRVWIGGSAILLLLLFSYFGGSGNESKIEPEQNQTTLTQTIIPQPSAMWEDSKMAYKNGDLEEALVLLNDLRDEHQEFAEAKNVNKVIDQIEKKLLEK